MDHRVVMLFAKYFPERTKQVEKVDTHNSQGWWHCVIPLAKYLVGMTGKVEKVKEGVVRRQGTEEGQTKVR
jgi:hypothetical protein